jgi:hypothetical protein
MLGAFMEISNYDPPSRSPSPPTPPPRKHRSALFMAALFVGGFGVTLAVLNRHELAAMISHHAAKPAITAARAPAYVPTQQRADTTNVQRAPAQAQQAAAMPPSVFQ